MCACTLVSIPHKHEHVQTGITDIMVMPTEYTGQWLADSDPEAQPTTFFKAYKLIYFVVVVQRLKRDLKTFNDL